MRVFNLFLSILWLSLFGPLQETWGSSPDENASIEFFEIKIRPLLTEKCLSCHGSKKQEGGLNLTSRSRAMAGGDSGKAVLPGKPQESLLIRAVDYQSDLKMPPDGKLSDSKIADLNRWVQDGAIWPGNDAAEIPDPADAVHSDLLWSLQPVRDAPIPDVVAQDWPVSPVDRFILAALEQRGLAPAAPADKRTLLRRITFDLIGLPPSIGEIENFLNDQTPTAFAKVVDRLLASPHYGERWGRHWLDVVRYADARDLIQLPAESDFREAWRYRDWVVKAFNQDLPYDQFVKMQIAGDLMQPVDPSQIDADALVATGLLAIADFVPGDVNKEQMIADCVNDQIDVVGRTFMGMTIACARCHDHKFDPISTDDYYSLAGIFFSTRVVPGPVPGNTPLIRVPLLSADEIKAIEAQAERDRQRLTELSSHVQTSADREYAAYLEQQAVGSIQRDLPLVIEYLHRVGIEKHPPIAEFAESRGINSQTLERWIPFLIQQPALTQFNPRSKEEALREAPSLDQSTEIQDLARKLAAISESRRQRKISDPVYRTIAESQMLQFRADDRGIATDTNGHIVLWPDRAAVATDAIPVTDIPSPQILTTGTDDTMHVIRFDGSALLQTQRSVPATGSLFAVFRPAPNTTGTRLVGWEDSAGGQHGVGLMLTANGGLHAIFRRNGVSGDIVVPPSGTLDFQLVSLIWGPGGVTCFRNGEFVGTNTAIECVSSDPALSVLRIGGPGSGTGQQFEGDLCELQVYAAPLDEAARIHIENELRIRWLEPSSKQSPLTNNDPVADLYDELLSPRSPYWINSELRMSTLPEVVRQRMLTESAELEALKNKPAVEIPRAVVVQEGGPPGTKHEGFHDAQIYIRGNPANPGATVARGFPKALSWRDSPSIQDGSGRRELALWLTDRNNPLTARVIVNRLWQHHFGEGLVRTSTNFGYRGERPSHPGLLDYLASRFVESGWSVKAMQRMIVLSSVYQQGSLEQDADPNRKSSRGIDPDNRLLSHMPRRRLEAEAIRDSLLSVSGLLDPAQGGPGFLEIAVPRRSLYLMSVRTGAKTSDFNSLFDGPDGGGIIERRGQSIVAPQALFLMNNVWLDQVSAALNARIFRETPGKNDQDRVRLLYEIALGRPPVPAEVEIGMQLVSNSGDDNSWVRYCRLILCSNEFIYVD